MKASVYSQYGPPSVIHLQELANPTPAEDEVLIRIYATTVTAVDTIFRRGDAFFARMATGIRRPKTPILGTEFAGVVETVGPKVNRYEVGDRVFGDSSQKQGTHAEYITLPEDGAFRPMPSKLTFEKATAMPYGFLTALPFLRDIAHISEGKKLLIVGASGAVGTAAVQLGKYFGAKVTGVCSGTSSDLVQSLGADHIIDYTKTDFTAGDTLYDVIFDTVGKSSYPKSKGVLAQKGIFMTTVIGFPILYQMAGTRWSKKKAMISFTGLRSDENKGDDLELLRKLVSAGKYSPVIDRKYSFDQIIEAHKYVDQGHKKGNVVIKINGRRKPVAA